MDMSCEDVWREISNYIDNDLDPHQRAALGAHLGQCRNCAALLEGTRNVIRLYQDERLLALPAGFTKRLHRKLRAEIQGPPGSAFGWAVSLATASVLGAVFLFANLHHFAQPQLKSAHSQPAARWPAGPVAVSDDGKTFHVVNCPFLRGKWKLVATREAIQKGYSPCVRCMREYLKVGRGPESSEPGVEFAEEVESNGAQ